MKLSDKHRWYADMLDEYKEVTLARPLSDPYYDWTVKVEYATHYMRSGSAAIWEIPDSYTPK